MNDPLDTKWETWYTRLLYFWNFYHISSVILQKKYYKLNTDLFLNLVRRFKGLFVLIPRHLRTTCVIFWSLFLQKQKKRTLQTHSKYIRKRNNFVSNISMAKWKLPPWALSKCSALWAMAIEVKCSLQVLHPPSY